MGLADDVARLEAGTAFADRSDRGFVLVSGPDTFSFLQALVSADLDPLVDGTGADSLLLQPQGKLDVAFRLLRASSASPDAPDTVIGDVAVLDCDPGMSGPLTASLLKYRIRVKAEVLDGTGELAMLSFLSGAAPAPPVALPDTHTSPIATSGSCAPATVTTSSGRRLHSNGTWRRSASTAWWKRCPRPTRRGG